MKLFKQAPSDVRRRIFLLIIILFLLNASVWFFTFLSISKYPLLFGLVVIAYGFGLRHAVDADHIAAIDNTTRKLMQDGKKPVAVGFFFSLGHATIVIILSLLIAISTSFVQQHLSTFEQTGSLIGSSVSSFFLLVIGIINLIALLEIYKIWKDVKKGKKFNHTELNSL